MEQSTSNPPGEISVAQLEWDVSPGNCLSKTDTTREPLFAD